jgi:hypothetical protein
MLKRNRTKHKTTLEERLAHHAKKAQDDLALLPKGETREALIHKIREIEAAIYLNQTLAKKK